MNEKMKEIGLRIKELRELSDISAQGMADHLKIPLETYQEYEDGKKDIPASILFEISQKMQASNENLIILEKQISEETEIVCRSIKDAQVKQITSF